MTRLRLLGLTAVLSLLALTDGHQTRPAFSQTGGKDLVILSTGALQGELAPCG